MNVYPKALSKEQIAAEAGYEAKGGGFLNALGRLRTLGLIEGRSEIVASNYVWANQVRVEIRNALAARYGWRPEQGRRFAWWVAFEYLASKAAIQVELRRIDGRVSRTFNVWTLNPFRGNPSDEALFGGARAGKLAAFVAAMRAAVTRLCAAIGRERGFRFPPQL